MRLVCEVAIAQSANTIHSEISTPWPLAKPHQITSIIWKADLHLTLDTSRTFGRCMSMMFSRTRSYICFTSLNAGSVLSATWLKDASPFSFDVFGHFGYENAWLIVMFAKGKLKSENWVKLHPPAHLCLCLQRITFSIRENWWRPMDWWPWLYMTKIDSSITPSYIA